MGKPDDNNNYVAMGVDPSGNPKAISLDNTTGYLNGEIESTEDTPSNAWRAKYDENNNPAAKVVDPNGNIIPLLVNSEGKVWINFTAE